MPLTLRNSADLHLLVDDGLSFSPPPFLQVMSPGERALYRGFKLHHSRDEFSMPPASTILPRDWANDSTSPAPIPLDSTQTV